MNVTIISHSYLPNVGGVEVCVENLCKQFVNRGHKVNIITDLRSGDLKSHEIIDGIVVDRLPFYPLILRTLSPISIFKFIRAIFMSPFVVFRLWRLLKRRQVEVINLQYVDVGRNAVYVLLISYIYKFRLVVTLHGFSVTPSHLPKRYFWIYSKILKRANYVTACSEYLLKDNQKMVPDIKERSSTIPNGVDLEAFELKNRYYHRRPYILSLGRLQSWQKGFDILLMSFKEILDRGYDVDLVIAGDGPMGKIYKHIIGVLKVKDRTKLFGLANRQMVVALFNGCQFFVMPSRVEPFGIVNLEAMAAGKAVVATDTMGVPEIVKDGVNGILVRPKDIKALAKAMIQLLDDSSLMNRLGQNGRRMAREYAWDKIANRYLEIFEKVLKDN